jgi:hypothetical protein
VVEIFWGKILRKNSENLGRKECGLELILEHKNLMREFIGFEGFGN